MEGKLIIHYTASDPRWDELYELWTHCANVTAFVDAIRTDYPDLLCGPWPVEEIYEVSDDDERYILCCKDGMDECVSIYERLNIYEELPF